MAVASLALHLLPHPGYGFHRDELLYLAMGDHLSLLHMEFPPLIALLAQVARALPLDLLHSIRLLSALAAAALTVLAAMHCRILGGGARSQHVAALAVLAAPLFLRAGSLFQPVVFEQLWWSVALFALLQLLAGANPRWWLLLGAALGVAALTKFSVAFLGAGLLLTILFSPLRSQLGTRWPWLGAGVAALLALPSVTGQVAWGWPFLAQAQALRVEQLGHVSPAGFLGGQFFMLGLGGPFWVIGLLGLLLAPSLRRFRPAGLLALTVMLLLLLGGGKDYYFGPMHPLLIAAATALLGGWFDRPGRIPVYAIAVVLLLIGGASLLPVGIPLLPPERMARYAAALGLAHTTETNLGGSLPLPQDFADMTGWREQVEAVSRVFHSLSVEEQRGAAIYATNYGRAGALAVYHREYGLPYPISRNGDFGLWGTGTWSGGLTIVVGGSPVEFLPLWSEVTEAGRSINAWGVEEERSVPIFICRHPRQDLPALFLRLGPDWT